MNVRRKKVFGQSLTEYASIGIMVALVSVGACVSLGDTFHEFMPALLTAIFNQPSPHPADSTHTPNSPQAAVAASSQSNTILPQQAGTQQVCLQTGLCISVPTIAAGPLTETTGGLGGNMTLSLSDSLSQLAKQLQAQQADPTLTNLVLQMANTGHGIGNNLSLVENSCPAGTASCSWDAFMNSGTGNSTVAGISAHWVDHPNADGTTTSTHVVSIDTQDFQSAQQALNDYLTQHPNPGVSNIINSEGAQILNIANGLQLSHTDTYTDPNVRDWSTLTFNSNNDAVLVHQDANTICNTGGNSACLKPVVSVAP